MKITLQGIRISIVVFVFLAIINYSYREYLTSREWTTPLEMVIYPINADNSHEARTYINNLRERNFEDIVTFYEEQGEHYHVAALPPVRITLGTEITELPPERDRNTSFLGNILWSLRLRYWAYKNTPETDSPYVIIRMYVMYHKLEYNVAVPHSSGLQKGLLGVIHAFADSIQQKQNNVIIAHEFLHTVGAGDKYNPRNDQPLVPDGLANAEQEPLYPQRKAELMAGRIAVSAHECEMPRSLRQCVIGEKTAQEIGWVTH